MMASLEIYCAYAESGNWYCYQNPDGKTKIRVGCSHRNPTDAARHADDLKGRKRAEHEDRRA